MDCPRRLPRRTVASASPYARNRPARTAVARATATSSRRLASQVRRRCRQLERELQASRDRVRWLEQRLEDAEGCAVPVRVPRKRIKVLQKDKYVNALAWRSDGLLASGTDSDCDCRADDTHLAVWRDGKCVWSKRSRGEETHIEALAWSRDGVLASGGGGNKIMLWRETPAGSFERTHVLDSDTKGTVWALAWSSDGVLASGMMELSLWA